VSYAIEAVPYGIPFWGFLLQSGFPLPERFPNYLFVIFGEGDFLLEVFSFLIFRLMMKISL